MFWIQSGISSNVSPNFHRGADKVSKSFSAYQTLSSIEFPAEFTGKEAVATTLRGLDACYSGAEALPGMLSGIGRGMSLKDMASYADLLSLFKTTQQDLTSTEVGATIFQNTGYKPTDSEIQAILANSLDQFNNGYGPAYGYGPGGEQMAMERGAALLGAVDALATGAKETFWGFTSGAFGFVGDTIGGVFTAGANLFNRPDLAYEYSKLFDFGGQVDECARQCGVNTDSLFYSGAKVGGQIAANIGVMLIPGVGAHATIANAVMYTSQSYTQNYRGTIDNYFAKNNMDVPKPYYSDIAKAKGYITPEMYQNAQSCASSHAIITLATTIATGNAATPISKGMGILGNESTTLAQKMGLNAFTHACGSLVHQAIDVQHGNRDKVNPLKVAGAALMSAGATYISKPKSEPGRSTHISKITDTLANTKVGNAVSKAANVVSDTANVVNEAIRSTVPGQVLVNTGSKIVNTFFDDLQGGDHSFGLPFVEDVTKKILNIFNN